MTSRYQQSEYTHRDPRLADKLKEMLRYARDDYERQDPSDLGCGWENLEWYAARAQPFGFSHAEFGTTEEEITKLRQGLQILKVRSILFQARRTDLIGIENAGGSLAMLDCYYDWLSRFNLSHADIGESEQEIASLRRNLRVCKLEMLLRYARMKDAESLAFLQDYQKKLLAFHLSHADAGTTEEEIAQLREELTRPHKESTVTPT